MSLIKLFKSSTRLFKKDVITFLIIRRHDLGICDENLRYIAVRPGASMSNLRQKVWHLLALPDYCEEIIILKSDNGKELPLTDLRKGNDPQHPYYIEVWLPGKQPSNASLIDNMLTMGTNESVTRDLEITDNTFEEKVNREFSGKERNRLSFTTVTNEIKTFNKIRQVEPNQDMIYRSDKKPELSCKISTSSIFFKLHGRKSRDNFGNILLKIQSDLKTLNNKLSNLEKRIQI